MVPWNGSPFVPDQTLLLLICELVFSFDDFRFSDFHLFRQLFVCGKTVHYQQDYLYEGGPALSRHDAKECPQPQLAQS